MATSRLNIFNSLPQAASDDEDEGFTRGQFKGAPPTKKHAPKDAKPKTQTQGGQAGATGGQKEKDDHKKGKGVPPPGTHPFERKSGTGYSAFDKKLKKGGAGKGNWGTARDERPDEGKGEEETGEEVQEETAQPTGLTLEEYYSKVHIKQSQPEINEAKAKVTSEQLMKELLSNKATILPSKKSKESEEPKPHKKKNPIEVDHHAALTTEHADLLNFRTGFIERDFKSRGEKTEQDKPPRKEFKKEEGEKTEIAEGEKAEGQEASSPTKEGGERRRGGGAGRGGKGGATGGRGGYKGGYTAQPKVNFEDESSFPKLG